MARFSFIGAGVFDTLRTGQYAFDMDENRCELPKGCCSDQPPQSAQIRRRISKRLRVLFFLHAFVLVVCLVAGMSEVYPYLAWGQFLMPVAALLSPANIALPIVIFVRGRAEEVPTAALVFAVFLSVLMTIASFFAMLPLVS